jgi:alcohol dehydrogenase YqhD (iron-dependent ADH family)
MNKFIYNIPTKVYFGENQLGNLGRVLSEFGNKVLLVYGGGSIKKMGLYDKIVDILQNANIDYFELSGVEPNPRVTSVREGADICKKNNIDAILAVGGGSVIDCAKYIGAATYYDGDAWDLMSYETSIKKCLPIIDVLTLSATGSEMDTAGFITNLDTQEKIGRLHPLLFPKVSFLDPTNTYTVNEYQTACGSVDIISHILEVYLVVDQDFYMLDSIMESLIKTVVKYAPLAIKEPENYEARANLMWASSWAINGFITCGKTTPWAVHAIEHELSAIYDITHGLGLAILTPRYMEYLLNDNTAKRIASLGVNVFDIDKSLPENEIAKQAISEFSDFFFKTLGLKSTLKEIDIDASNFEIMAQKACKGAPRGKFTGFGDLEKQDIVKILEMCL